MANVVSPERVRPLGPKISGFEIDGVGIDPMNQRADKNRDDDECKNKDADKSAFVLSKLAPDVGPHGSMFRFDYSGIH